MRAAWCLIPAAVRPYGSTRTTMLRTDADMKQRAPTQLGFTMLEILVSLIILVFGLLGLIGLQARSQVATFESYQRGQALILVQDMADRIATNRGAAGCYSTTTPLGTGFTGTPVCAAATGTTATRATADADL